MSFKVFVCTVSKFIYIYIYLFILNLTLMEYLYMLFCILQYISDLWHTFKEIKINNEL